MATAAQTLANQANAQHSTGPKTAEGKAKASENNIKHGLCLGILVLSPDQQAHMAKFEAKMRQELKPFGAMEETVFAQFIDAAARLEKSRASSAASSASTTRTRSSSPPPPPNSTNSAATAPRPKCRSTAPSTP